MYKYYILSSKNHHALGVIDESETTMTVQKLKVDKVFNSFSNSFQDEIVPDYSMEQVNNAILPKEDFAEQFDNVEITKDYWTVFEYLTGRKRSAVSTNTEN